ncbi:cupin domain-containing protein [Amycolatopsis aidingensis]|uniref:cupin domain-containing protein n=1 Tax=Amycolatopsis aidingensis TaxID=2842453 RepID=UPI001E52CD48|nr:cupin domain-containing protein [Amycolatopsis aidingensis]
MTATVVRKIRASEVPANRRRGGDVRVVLSPKTVQATSGFGGTVTLVPGEYICEHYHPYSEEFVHVVHGSVLMRVGTEEITLEPGDALMVPVGVRHRMENQGTERAHLVFHLSPLAPRPELGHVDTETRPDGEQESAPEVGGPR